MSAPAPFDAARFLATVARQPGVYVFLDARGDPLYVGKAGNLRNRLASYFRGSGLTVKTRAMVSRVAAVETHRTHTETEALLLENNLIKSLRPRYNVLLRDDKNYPYIRLTSEDDFPRLMIYRGRRSLPGRYFGPYPSAGSARETLHLLQKIFQLRQCEDPVFRNRSRPCLQHQIRRCTAPCVGRIERDAYLEDVRQAVDFLEGRDQSLVELLGEKMERASRRLEFEAAAIYRDRIAALQRVQQRQYVAGESGDADAIAVAAEGGAACFYVSVIRHGRSLGGRCHVQPNPLALPEPELLQTFLAQHYLGRPVPREILLGGEVAERDLLQRTLAEQSGHPLSIRSRCRGHRRHWIEAARVNAADRLRQHLNATGDLGRQHEALAAALELEEVPARLECYDISHTGGERTVASCVVFDREGPVKSDYRRFNIEGIEAGDDYAAMRQVLTRRFRRLLESEGKIPDLVLIDGGRGQLGAAHEALQELQATDLLLLGISKGPGRKPGDEKLHLFGRPQAVILDPASPALHLLQRVRDEAHRFAITSHRQRRGKARTRSPLEAIPGIGEKRRRALLTHLGGLREIRRAGIEDLARVPGISPALAERIYNELH